MKKHCFENKHEGIIFCIGLPTFLAGLSVQHKGTDKKSIMNMFPKANQSFQ